VAGTVVSLIGAVALSVSTESLAQFIALPTWLAGPLAWHWP
jgi:hypothetical protein